MVDNKAEVAGIPQRSLGKLRTQLGKPELAKVKLYLDGFFDQQKAIQSGEQNLSLDEIIQLKKVKENADLTKLMKAVRDLVTRADTTYTIDGQTKPAISGKQIDANLSDTRALLRVVLDIKEEAAPVAA